MNDNEASTAGGNDDGLGSDDDDPAAVIVADVLADEANDQPIFTDEESSEHRVPVLPPLTSVARKTIILKT